MTIGYPAGNVSVLGAPYDRTPVVVPATFASTGVAPHASTTRTTLTVPSSVKQILTALFMLVHRRTAPGAAAAVSVWTSYTPSGGANINLYWSPENFNPAADVLSQVQNLAPQIPLFPGDVIDQRTSDGSTGGTVDYFLTLLTLRFT